MTRSMRNNQPPLYTKTIDSPIGPLKLVANSRGICALLFHGGSHARIITDSAVIEKNDHPILLRAEKQLGEYFAGKRKNFDLPLDAKGSVFQLKVWRELEKIPYAETISYGEQARRMGDARKARAAGMANGRNPISIIVPCHRVVGASGALTGFGGGLKTKKFLLDLEKKYA